MPIANPGIERIPFLAHLGLEDGDDPSRFIVSDVDQVAQRNHP